MTEGRLTGADGGLAGVPAGADEDSAWWWAALAAGELLLPRCRRCERCWFPPSPSCPHCGGDDFETVVASGLGSVYSWVVVHVALDPAFVADVPYTIVAVDLDEGPRLFGRRLSDEAVRPTAGERVRARAIALGGTTMLGFEPAADETGGEVG